MTTKLTKITAHERIVLSAVLGGSNMGQPLPKREDVQHELEHLQKQQYPHTALTLLQSASIHFWSRCMESDEHERWFYEECRSWYRDKTNWSGGREYVAHVWPDVAALVW